MVGMNHLLIDLLQTICAIILATAAVEPHLG